MKRVDIIALVQEVIITNSNRNPLDFRLTTLEQIEHFAALVAAAEREAIAQMIEDAPPLVEFSQNDKGGCMVCGFTPKLASVAIRARSES
jgi:hypothetical protein